MKMMVVQKTEANGIKNKTDMKLKHITFTGIDANTDIQDLIEIQHEFPIAEFGVLTSYHWVDNGNRYVNPAFLSNLYAGNGNLNLALHVCGSAAHDVATGEWIKIDNHLFGSLGLFKRIQLNVANRKDNPEYLWIPPYKGQELIVQQRDADNTELYNITRDIWFGDDSLVSVLLDASGGQGIDTPIKVLPNAGKPFKVGYAGGIGPDNVGDKLHYLLTNDEVGDFWIDMESGVRTDDWFDTAKVCRVLRICKEVIKDLGIED